MLLQMSADGMGDRVSVGSRAGGITASDLATRAARLGTHFTSLPGERIGIIDLNSAAVPLTLFGSALGGKPFVPMNYRLTDEQLKGIVARTAPAAIVVGEGIEERLGPIDGIQYLPRKDVLAISEDESLELADPYLGDPDSIAVLLYTSGTTGEPKAAVLRHRNLASYILSTVEFAGADEDEAALVSVPPYHIAGVSAVLSSTYSGRRLVYMESFDPESWVAEVRREGITHAMVVPTMLNRILEVVEADGQGLPSLRSLSYGGGPMPVLVIERALRVLPECNFVNAYGLTETSSTIALLGPDDHREAIASDDPAVRARLGSVGRPLPTLTVSIRDPDGEEVVAGERGEIWVLGEQVSGEYLGRSKGSDDGWFRTRDAGHLDADGFLYVHGRLDDVIVRGGENLSPGEIEDTLLDHPAVASAAVVGIPDTDWGEKVVAAITLEPGATVEEGELKDFVRERLRSTKTPEHIAVRDELPFNETGKLLRRVLRDELAAQYPAGA
jgi:acyl-CoA synthetase (AMP-forming)/AMP-acid ligase II